MRCSLGLDQDPLGCISTSSWVIEDEIATPESLGDLRYSVTVSKLC